jgi:hypothetical protein
MSLLSDVTTLIRVHRFIARGNIVSPGAILILDPVAGQAIMLVLVGASVITVGVTVGPLSLDFVGEKVGYGVGADVVLCVIWMSSMSKACPL